jgi:aspartokinase
VTTSDIRITCLIKRAQVKEAVRALHKAFVLQR